MRYGDCDEYVEIDMGGRRLTHHPSGDTALRHPWMIESSKGFTDWRDRVLAFVAAHPGCHLMRNVRREVIDDLRRWPYSGGGYAVGDVVVSLDGIGAASVAREVVARVEEHPDAVDASRLDLDHHLLLDDGNVLYWSPYEDRWCACDVDGSPKGRTRPLMDRDDRDALVPATGRLLDAVCQDAIGTVYEATGMRGSHKRCALGREVAGEAEAHVAAMLRVRASVAAGVASPDEAPAALRGFADWVDVLRKGGTLDGHASHEERDAVRRARTVADTVERRAEAGVAPRP